MADAHAPGAQGAPPDNHVPDQGEQALSNLVNSAVSSHLRRQLPKLLEESLAPFRALLERPAAPAPTPPAPAPAPAPSGAPAAASATAAAPAGDPAALQRITELETALKRVQEQRAAEQREARENNALAALKAELGRDNRVRPEGLEHAAKLLFHVDKTVRVDQHGKISVHLDGEELELAEGVTRWLQRPEAAIYRPAPGYGAQKPKPRPGAAPPPRHAIPPAAPLPGAQREDPLTKTLRDLGLA